MLKTFYQPFLSHFLSQFLFQISIVHMKEIFYFSCVKGYSENDKDCPACHTKNMQILDALKAQSESRGQHEAFHNLLDRSPEPFSVVAEYFGRGLFNKIVIVEENTNSEVIHNRQIN